MDAISLLQHCLHTSCFALVVMATFTAVSTASTLMRSVLVPWEIIAIPCSGGASCAGGADVVIIFGA